MLLGCVLVMIVLVLFLFDWRSALISAAAIPLSLTAAVLVLYWRGGTINTMVLAGLGDRPGEVVDDAIIDVENIMRRLRMDRELDSPRSALRVVLVRLPRGAQCRGLRDDDCDPGILAGVLSGRDWPARSSGLWRYPTCSRSWLRCWSL